MVVTLESRTAFVSNVGGVPVIVVQSALELIVSLAAYHPGKSAVGGSISGGELVIVEAQTLSPAVGEPLRHGR
jgi:hypothetical protein